jgi:hypothetical protein
MGSMLSPLPMATIQASGWADVGAFDRTQEYPTVPTVAATLKILHVELLVVSVAGWQVLLCGSQQLGKSSGG